MKPEKSKRHKWTWTDFRSEQGDRVVEVVNELPDYWPLSLRQIYYRLVAAGHIENKRSAYNDLSKLIKHMRLDEWLPWEVLGDRNRQVTDKRGWEDAQEFMEAHLQDLFEGYERQNERL